jgi:hypothetical protein
MQAFYHLSHMPAALFALVIFEIWYCSMSTTAHQLKQMGFHKLFAWAGLKPQPSWSSPPE